MASSYTIDDFSENEDISGLKGYHYRRVFKGYDNKGNPKYTYKVILDGEYKKNPFNNGEFHINGANAVSQAIPRSVLDFKKVGDKKEIKIRKSAPGNKRWTETIYKIWNGNDYVNTGDPTLVPNRAVPGDGTGSEVEVVTDGTEGNVVLDNSELVNDDSGNIYSDSLKIDWTGNVGEGNYTNFFGPSEELKVSGRNSMPSTKWANTAEGDYYTFKGKRYKKGSVGARRADNLMAAKERAKAAARLRIQNKG